MKINFADAILKLRAHYNMSQDDFAKFLGVSFTSVNRWENGIHEPTKLAKVKIINLLKENNIEVEEVE